MNIDVFYEKYKNTLNDYHVTSTEGVSFLQRVLEDKESFSESDVKDLLATHHAEIFGQDGSRGIQNKFLHAKDDLNSANIDCLESQLPIHEPTTADIKLEEEAHQAAEIVDSANYELGKYGELSDELKEQITYFGQDQAQEQ